MKVKSLILTILLNLAIDSFSFAATFYISPTGSDSLGNGSITTPWRTFTTAKSNMSSGDTLIYKNGIYDYTGSNISDPISGSPGAYTVIQAETAGLVTIIATGTAVNLQPVDITGNASYQPQYIRIEGFSFRNTVDCITISGNSDISRANHIEIKNCTGRSSAGVNGAVCQIGNYAEDCLIEDCAFWGVNRTIVAAYGQYPEGAEHTMRITFRRVIARFDATTATAGGQNIFTFYGVQDSIYENCIAINANILPDPLGGFRNRSTPDQRNKFLGCISLNVGNFFPFYFAGASVGNETIAENCVAAGTTQTQLLVFNNNPRINVSNFTLHGSTGAAITDFGGTASVKNILFHDCGSGITGTTPSYCHFDNSGTTQGSNASSGNSGMLYLTRIENNSSCKGIGEGGVDKGANIVNRYVDGVLTGTALWPFPNEERYRNEMREAYSLPNGSSPSTNDSARGFCADGTTLTKYIWEYLGNTIPPEIYGSSLSGDLTGDAQVNIQDLQACVNHILGVQNWGSNADVNEDSSVNILDVQRIANIILGE